MKKLLSIFTVFLFGMMTSLSARDFYTVDHFVYTIVKYNDDYEGHTVSGPFAQLCGIDDPFYMPNKVNVPANVTIEGNTFPVKVVGYSYDQKEFIRFSSSQKISTLTLGENVEVISSIDNLQNLSTVNFNNNLKLICGSFGACPSLSSVVLPDGLIGIINSFNDRNNNGEPSILSSVSIPSTVNLIKTSFIQNSLKEVSFKMPVSTNEVVPLSILQSFDSKELTSLTLPARLDNIDHYVGGESLQNFYTSPDCEKYQSVDGILYKKNFETGKWDGIIYPSSHVTDTYKVPQLISGGRILKGFCNLSNTNSTTKLSNIDFSDLSEPIEINDGAFEFNNKSNIYALVLDNVSVLGSSAFRGLPQNVNITIGKDMTHVSPRPFGSSIVYLNVNPENELYCTYSDNILYKKLESGGLELVVSCKTPNTVVIRDDVEIIGNEGFAWDSTLTEITLPIGLRRIESLAFWATSKLTKINYKGQNLEYVSTSAFSGDDFGLNASAWWSTQPDGPIYLGNLFYKYKGGADTNTRYSVKVGTTVINDYAFSKYTNDGNAYYSNWKNGLTSITIPSTVKTIRKGAFQAESNLISVNLNNGLESIGESAFNKTGITSINIPSSVKRIENSAFSLSKLQNDLTIPDNVQYIGKSAFNYCENITRVRIGDYFSDNVITIEERAFENLKNCQELLIGEAVKNIANFTFSRIAEATTEGIDINIPESIVNIGDFAFYEGKVKTLSIGSNVKSIGSEAFNFKNESMWDNENECSVITLAYLKEVHSFAANPPVYSYGAEYHKDALFNEYDYKHAPLFVPKGSVDAYKAAEGWCHFSIIVEEGTDLNATPALFTENPDLPIEIFTLSGIKVFEGLANDVQVDPGIYLMRQGGNTKKIKITD